MSSPVQAMSALSDTKASVDVSIVCAVYNEGHSVDLLLDRLQEVLPPLGLSFELVFVDDGSKDDTLNRLKRHLGTCPGLRVVELSRNFGQVSALSAGLTVAVGRWVVIMDGDLQCDPGDIPILLEASRRGHDLVATYRVRRYEGIRRKVITWVGNRINRYLTGLDILDFGSVFRVIDTRIIDELKDWQGHVHYNTPMLYACAKNVVQLPITQHQRVLGKSKWTFAMFLSYNLDFMTASSRLTELFLGLSFVGILAGFTLYTLKLLHIFENVEAVSAPAYIFLSSLQLALLGVIWREVIQSQKFAKGAPPFVIRAVWWDNEAPADVN